jgi:hypothetical protein
MGLNLLWDLIFTPLCPGLSIWLAGEQELGKLSGILPRVQRCLAAKWKKSQQSGRGWLPSSFDHFLEYKYPALDVLSIQAMFLESPIVGPFCSSQLWMPVLS